MNITKAAIEYINNHPSIKDALKKDIVNYSKLARIIAKDLDINLKKNFQALVIACRRYKGNLTIDKQTEQRIKQILEKSKIQIKNKMIEVIVEKNINYDNIIELQKEIRKKREDIHIIHGANAIALITSEEFLETIRSYFKYKIIKITKDLAEIIIKSAREIKEVPGLMAYLYSLFGEQQISIIETMSSWLDTIFVIEEKDLNKVIQLFNLVNK